MTAPIPGRRYRAGDAEGAWWPYGPRGGHLRLDDGTDLPITRGLEQHLVLVEQLPERRVVLTCGRSRVYGVLEPDLRGETFWYVHVEGAPGPHGFGKADWTLADEDSA